MPEQQIEVTTETVLKWTRYKNAKEAKAAWTAEEKAAKADLLLSLGYDLDDPKPAPSEAVSNGERLFEIKVGDRKGLDLSYFRDKHPDVYAECERVTHPVSIREL